MNNEIPREVFSRKLENLQRLMEQPPVPEDGEFSEEDIDKYVFGVRVERHLFGQSSIIIPFPIHNFLLGIFNQFLQPALK